MDIPLISNWRRSKLLATPISPEWQAIVSRSVWQFERYSHQEQQRLEDICRILIAEKYWEGCGGLTLTDEIEVIIAANAAVPLLGLDGYYYADVESVLVYPDAFVVPAHKVRGSVVDASVDVLAGGAFTRGGPVIISWGDVTAQLAGHQPRRNVIIHEFAHKLDQRDGPTDGVPQISSGPLSDEWAQVMSAEYQSLVESARRGERSTIDRYGATNAAEFFAVVTEAFFMSPVELRSSHTSLYNVLGKYYAQDPASR